MKLIELEDLWQFSDLLERRSWHLADFELCETDTTDPRSDELWPVKGSVTVRRRCNGAAREYPTGDGTAWVADFQRDLAAGVFG